MLLSIINLFCLVKYIDLQDIYTSFHIRKYEIQTHMTSYGYERITNKIPHLEAHLLRNLDKNGIVIIFFYSKFS